MESVELIPQPGVALLSVIEKFEKRKEELAEIISIGKTLAIDLYFYSLDYVTFSEWVLDHSISGSSLLASSRIMERAAELIRKKIGFPFGKEMRREAVEEATLFKKPKILHFENYVEAEGYVKKASDFIGDSSLKEILGHLRETNIDVVTLDGGGSKIFIESVKRKFTGQIVLSEHPVSAYAKVFEYSWS
ncbi:hypothetical protein GLV89_15245 [Halomonas alkaliantarctica]|nr:hypothetical protein [Halomonas alkaliantarctica]